MTTLLFQQDDQIPAKKCIQRHGISQKIEIGPLANRGSVFAPNSIVAVAHRSDLAVTVIAQQMRTEWILWAAHPHLSIRRRAANRRTETFNLMKRKIPTERTISRDKSLNRKVFINASRPLPQLH